MIVKRNIWKRLGRTILHAALGSGAFIAMAEALSSTGDVTFAVKVGLATAGAAIASAVHGWIDNNMPKRRDAPEED